MINDIHARVPINKQAAIVVSEVAEYKPKKIIQNADSDFPIATRKLEKNIKDLAGTRFGKFIVIVLAKHVPKRWVVKCACGVYTLRTSKSINNPQNNRDQCELCRHLEHLKMQDLYKRIGDKADIMRDEEIKKSREALPAANPRPTSANPI